MIPCVQKCITLHTKWNTFLVFNSKPIHFFKLELSIFSNRVIFGEFVDENVFSTVWYFLPRKWWKMPSKEAYFQKKFLLKESSFQKRGLWYKFDGLPICALCLRTLIFSKSSCIRPKSNSVRKKIFLQKRENWTWKVTQWQLIDGLEKFMSSNSRKKIDFCMRRVFSEKNIFRGTLSNFE